MASLSELKKIREPIKAVEKGTLKYHSVYSYMDDLERKVKGDESEDDR